MSYNFTSSPLCTPSLSLISTASCASSDAPFSPPGICGMPPSPSPANRTAPLTRSLRMEKGHPLQELFMIMYLGKARSESIQQHEVVLGQCAREDRRTDEAKRAEHVGRTKLAGRVGRTKLAERMESSRPNRKLRKTARMKIDSSTWKPPRENVSFNDLSSKSLAVSTATSSRTRTVSREQLATCRAPSRSHRNPRVEGRLILGELEWPQRRLSCVSPTVPLLSSPSSKFLESSPTTSPLLGKRARQPTESDLYIDSVDMFLLATKSVTSQMEDVSEYSGFKDSSLDKPSGESSRLAKRAKYSLCVSPKITSQPSPSIQWASAKSGSSCMELYKSEHRRPTALSQQRARPVADKEYIGSVEAWVKHVESARLYCDRHKRASSRRSLKNTLEAGSSSRPVHKPDQILPPITHSVTYMEVESDLSVLGMNRKDEDVFSSASVTL
ncbi:hypothetical protein [Phaffia rhodozyma]|uniref:Uncharacterized protein n=1 Tax=Phaffia rhodozyma TaxID=264483 RepID=A0A0F7SIB6_PHARH|nr:hypothetical protein [Phaffia rhodozyma]